MAGIGSDVLETFLSQLEGAEDVAPAITKELATLLAADKLPRAEQLAALYIEASGEKTL